MKQETNDLWVRAALGIGGNIGNTKQYLIDALHRLDDSDNISICMVSKLYKTPPWGKLDQASFLNACVLIETNLAAKTLLRLCLDIEQGLGRTRSNRVRNEQPINQQPINQQPINQQWGPRQIDIDILYYADQLISDDGLEVPHPRMTERAFVMCPLLDIDVDKQIRGRSVSQWARQLKQEGIEPVSDDDTWWLLGNNVD